jgi:glutamate synthase (NADPH) small chain
MRDGYTMDLAMAEAARCLLCHEPPCSDGCPASTDPGRFIRQLRLRNVKGAAATIKRNNILGASCGVLCPTRNLCQQACSASGIDRPIDIGGLQRFIVEHAREIGFQPLAAGAAGGQSVAVVGGGPSGLSCAATLAQAGIAVTVFEQLDRPGGIPQYVLPEHRMTRDILDAEIQDVIDLGVAFVCGRAVATREELEGLFDEGFDAVYLATGAWEPVRLELPGHDAEGVEDAIDFLLRSKADPAGTADRVGGREVAVIGGGDTAMDVAVSALNRGASDVYVLYRRSLQQMPGDEDEKLDALSAGVHFVILTAPVGYVVEQGRVAGVTVQRTRLGEPDESGRRSPQPIPGTEHVIPASVVVEAIGLRPPAATRQLDTVSFDAAGRIVVTADSGATARPAVYAGGDAARGPSLVVDAVADGKRAAAAIVAALDAEVTP